jgi:hypothetical protein
MIVNSNLEIEEQEGGTYVFPAMTIDGQRYTWALYVYKNGDAELYHKRDPKKGSLLGKPLKLGNPWDYCDHETEKIPAGDKRNLYKTDNYVCKKCRKEFRKV